MDNFLNEYGKIKNALNYGYSNKPLKFDDIDYKKGKKFIAECHRGYEKIQDMVVFLIEKLREDNKLTDREKEYRELILRKVIDHIAFSLLKHEIHIIRRLGTLNEIQKIDIKTIKQAKEEAIKYNSKSRQTFALLCDLTTFISFCDILRVDFRTNPPKTEYIELKSGKVNDLLLDKIDSYDVDTKSIDLIKNDSEIDHRHMKQAIRMMNQKIRLHQTQDIIKKDFGIDQDTQKKVMLIGNTLQENQYADFLNKLLNSAKESDGKISSGMVNYCIHLGACFKGDYTSSIEGAKKAALYSLSKQIAEANKELNAVRNELLSLSKISQKDICFGSDLFQTNLYSIGVVPFQTWFLDKDNEMDLISRKLCVFFIFDLPAFIWQARKIGINLTLSSRKVADEIKKDVGSQNVILFGNRLIEYDFQNKKGHMLGFISRLFTNLSSPIQLLHHHYKELCANFSADSDN